MIPQLGGLVHCSSIFSASNFSAPALATFSKLSMLDPTLPTRSSASRSMQVLGVGWIPELEAEIGSLARDTTEWRGFTPITEFFLNLDITLLATPAMAGLP